MIENLEAYTYPSPDRLKDKKLKITDERINLWICFYKLKYLNVKQIDMVWSIVQNNEKQFSRNTLHRWTHDIPVLKKKILKKRYSNDIYYLHPRFHRYISQLITKYHLRIPATKYKSPNPNKHDLLTRTVFLEALFELSKTEDSSKIFLDMDIQFFPFQKKNNLNNPRFIRTGTAAFRNVGDLYFRYRGTEYIIEYDNGTEEVLTNVVKLANYISYINEANDEAIKLYFVTRDNTVLQGEKQYLKRTPWTRIQRTIQAVYSDDYQNTLPDGKKSPFYLRDYIAMFSNFDFYCVSHSQTKKVISRHINESNSPHFNERMSIMESFSEYVYSMTELEASYVDNESEYGSKGFDEPQATRFNGVLTLINNQLPSYVPEHTREISVLFAEEYSYKDSVTAAELTNNFLRSIVSNDGNTIARPVLVVHPPRTKPQPTLTAVDFSEINHLIMDENIMQPFNNLTICHPIKEGKFLLEIGVQNKAPDKRLNLWETNNRDWYT